MTKWEYRKDQFKNYSETKLNEIGNEGWELTSVVLWPHTPSSTSYIYYFKRPIPETKQEPSNP